MLRHSAAGERRDPRCGLEVMSCRFSHSSSHNGRQSSREPLISFSGERVRVQFSVERVLRHGVTSFLPEGGFGEVWSEFWSFGRRGVEEFVDIGGLGFVGLFVGL